MPEKTMIGICNIGNDRNVGGVILPHGKIAMIRDDVKALTAVNGGGFAISQGEAERFLNDWPYFFEPVYEEQLVKQSPEPTPVPVPTGEASFAPPEKPAAMTTDNTAFVPKKGSKKG